MLWNKYFTQQTKCDLKNLQSFKAISRGVFKKVQYIDLISKDSNKTLENYVCDYQLFYIYILYYSTIT